MTFRLTGVLLMWCQYLRLVTGSIYKSTAQSHCFVSKVMEKCIYEELLYHVSDKLYDYQHGFIKGRSTCSQLLKFVGDLSKSLDETGQTDVIYLDFAKAFDKVPHDLLLYK